MSDRIRTPSEIRAWLEANAGTVTAGLVAERAVRAVLGLHDEVTVNVFDDAQPVCREDGQEYDGVDLPGCRTTRAIDAEINHVLRGVGVSGEDRSEPTPAPREYRAGDTEPPVGTKLTGGGFTWTRHGRSWQTPEGGVLNWAQLTEFCPRLSEVVAPAPREPRQFDRDEPSGVIKVRDRLGRVWNRNDRNGFWYEHGCAPQTWPELWSQLRPLSEVVTPEGTP